MCVAIGQLGYSFKYLMEDLTIEHLKNWNPSWFTIQSIKIYLVRASLQVREGWFILVIYRFEVTMDLTYIEMEELLQICYCFYVINESNHVIVCLFSVYISICLLYSLLHLPYVCSLLCVNNFMRLHS